jgi:hypothetical protein
VVKLYITYEVARINISGILSYLGVCCMIMASHLTAFGVLLRPAFMLRRLAADLLLWLCI